MSRLCCPRLGCLGCSRSPALWHQIALVGLLIATSGCGLLPKQEAEAQSQSPGDGPTAVDVAVARTGLLREDPEYTGTTQPVREVSLRSRVEGRLIDLNVDVGDRVRQGQSLAQLDDALLVTSVLQAQAELAAQESEVARAQTEVSNARTQVEQARLELQQAQADAARLQRLLDEGAIAQQEAETTQTQARTAEQALRSAQEQVRTQQQAVLATQRRVAAQRAALSQEQQRRSYAALSSPIDGAVLERVSEPGNLVQPGDEILKLGDFSRVKVVVQVSERELANIRVRQAVKIRLDALPEQEFAGQVSRISPAADPTARLVPVEVTMANAGGRIGSGLLARVSFAQEAAERVLVPEAALQESEGQAKGTANLFVVAAAGARPEVGVRSVKLGERADGQVEILSGLQPGEQFVARSGRPLKDGDPVRLSILSEQPEQGAKP